MSNIKKIVAALLILAFTVFVAGCGSKTAAKVNGEKITQEHLEKRMNKIKLSYEQQGAKFEGEQGRMMLKAIEQQVLEEMINQTIILQAAEKEKLVASDVEVNKQYDEIKKRFGGDKQFDDAMKTYGYTEKELKDKLKYDATFAALYEKVTKDVKVTDDEISKYYESNKDQYKEPEKFKIRHILIAVNTADKKTGKTDEQAKKEAEKIIADLNAGADFAKLAKEKSTDPGSKDKGGLLTDRMGNEMVAKGGNEFVPEFANAAFALKAGQITAKPVKSEFGYHIIKVDVKTTEKQLTFDEAKEKIKKDLPTTKKQDVFNKYMGDLRTKADIVNKLAEENPAGGMGAPQGGGSQGGGTKDGGSDGQLPPNHPQVDNQNAGDQKANDQQNNKK